MDVKWFNFKYIILWSQEIIHQSFENIFIAQEIKKIQIWNLYLYDIGYLYARLQKF